MAGSCRFFATAAPTYFVTRHAQNRAGMILRSEKPYIHPKLALIPASPEAGMFLAYPQVTWPTGKKALT
jgi:hypothetical protein